MKTAKTQSLGVSLSSLLFTHFLVVAAAPWSALAQTSCRDFAEVKSAIDNVIDKDAAKGAHLRKEFKDGADSIHIIEQMVDDGLRKKIDICRYDVAEYLTKRGFPPSH